MSLALNQAGSARSGCAQGRMAWRVRPSKPSKHEREDIILKECLRRLRVVRLGSSKTPEAQAYLKFQRELYTCLLYLHSRRAERMSARNRPSPTLKYRV
ncbi:hypothetical protein V5799_005999 [Amblyomma americanum]|uniref:Uncharacterized protein n=1 Tax=Amblyomma americanum TaxID=6943 RepID=A0AAQ4DXN1_AMBAM